MLRKLSFISLLLAVGLLAVSCSAAPSDIPAADPTLPVEATPTQEPPPVDTSPLPEGMTGITANQPMPVTLMPGGITEAHFSMDKSGLRPLPDDISPVTERFADDSGTEFIFRLDTGKLINISTGDIGNQPKQPGQPVFVDGNVMLKRRVQRQPRLTSRRLLAGTRIV